MTLNRSDMSRAASKHHPPALRFKCRAEYVNGEATLPQLASKYSLKLGTLRDWCFAGRWSVARDRVLNKLASDQPPVVATPSVEPAQPGTIEARAHEYEQHLIRLRLQLAGETDAQKIDRLCAAIARLEDVYCRYASIPLPGSRKPKEPDKRSISRDVVPID